MELIQRNLDIYMENYGVEQSIYRKYFNVGKKSITSKISKNIDKSSIISLYSLYKENNIENFNVAVNEINENNTRNNIGKQVDVILSSKNNIIMTGILININDKEIVLRKDGKNIIINKYDALILDNIENSILKTILNITQDGVYILQTSYFINDISWYANHILLFNEEKSLVSMFNTNAIITNNTDQNYNNVNLNLIVGNINNKNIQEYERIGGAYMKSETVSNKQTDQNMSQDYTKYKINNPISLLSGETIQFSLFKQYNISVEKLYKYSLSQNFTENQAELSLNFSNIFGFPIPQGVARVYLSNNNLIGNYLGSNYINNISQNQLISISLGKTLYVTGSHTLFTNNIYNKDQVVIGQNINASVTISNLLNSPINLIITYPVYNSSVKIINMEPNLEYDIFNNELRFIVDKISNTEKFDFSVTFDVTY